MPSSYTSNLGFEKQADGENSATWGQKCNAVFDLIESAITDVGSISMSADTNKTLTDLDGSADESRSAVLEITSSITLTTTRSVIVPTSDKLYVISNGTTGGQSLLITTAAGTGVTVKNGEKRSVYCDGTDVVEGISAMASLALDTALPITSGGTGATSATAAKTALGIVDTSVPSGAVFHFAMNAAPSGYLACDGGAVSRTTYASLFTAIGSTFGAGDGSTTFNLPDMRGQFARGWNSTSSGIDPSRTFGSVQTDALQEHRHRLSTEQTGAFSSTFDGASNTNIWGKQEIEAWAVSTADTSSTPGGIRRGENDDPGVTNSGFGVGSIRTDTDVGINDDETRPDNVALLACIKT